MANPFKDADKRKKIAPGGGEKSPVVEEPVAPAAEEIVAAEPAAMPVAEQTDAPLVVSKSALAGLVQQKPRGKAYSLYLSEESNRKLEKLAKQLKCTKSKALDTLIQNVLE